ncbi:6-pyruvoyl tetrahydropterin synthase family protein [Halovivax sp.]|uniref:6-pyruvoyl trahydropterin synthase family protein n=1 Tax=Halovivax sp. TaxID=1935978 RepID=UPI0025B8484C|nr:6-carboxytetrahydropterin synthase [Halovivax sp.]
MTEPERENGPTATSYTVTVGEAFVAQHHLTVPGAGPEGRVHSHTFEAEATFRGPALGERGYLLDIDAATEALSTVVDRYRDETLNDHLEGNPSCERLAAAIHDDLRDALEAPAVEDLVVTVREDETAVVTCAGPF